MHPAGVGKHAARPQNSKGLQACARPARATTLQTAFCKEEGVPLGHRKRQGTGKGCNRPYSDLIQKKNSLIMKICNEFMNLSKPTSAQLPFPG
jgi:hypothetical protein